MSTLLNMAGAWFGGPFWTFIKSAPRWVWIALLVALGLLEIDRRVKGVRKRAYQKGRAEAEAELELRIDEANTEIDERINHAEEAGEAIDEALDLDRDGIVTTRDPDADQLRQLTGDDDQNRGPVLRGSGID